MQPARGGRTPGRRSDRSVRSARDARVQMRRRAPRPHYGAPARGLKWCSYHFSAGSAHRRARAEVPAPPAPTGQPYCHRPGRPRVSPEWRAATPQSRSEAAMLRQMSDMPVGTLGFEARGEGEDDDWEPGVEPVLRTQIADGQKVRMLYLLGPE